MRTIEFNGIQINIYNDLLKYGKEFLGVPDGAHADVEGSDMTGGCASIEHNSISFYVNPNHSFDELLETVAHELGHLITGGYEKNPPDEDGYSEEHEKKANHYQEFTMDAYKLAKKLHSDEKL